MCAAYYSFTGLKPRKRMRFFVADELNLLVFGWMMSQGGMKSALITHTHSHFHIKRGPHSLLLLYLCITRRTNVKIRLSSSVDDFDLQKCDSIWTLWQFHLFFLLLRVWWQGGLHFSKCRCHNIDTSLAAQVWPSYSFFA